MSVDEHTIELGSAPVFYRRTAAPGAAPLYLHEIASSSEDWVALLERTGGIAPDLIGFGRSAKGVELDYSVPGLADFAQDLLAALDADEIKLVGHGWGAAVALELARRRPDRVERMVLVNPLPLVDGFTWPRIARAWRVRGAGELTMGFTQRWMLARALRSACTNPRAWPDSRIDRVWSQFDQGTQRAILRLHRSVDEAQIPAPAPPPPPPTLIIWGEQDPWFPVEHADAYARRLPHAELERIAGAGHWPWLDRPEVIDRIAEFAGR